MTNKFSKAINWLIRGKNGKAYIFQAPNVPLTGWLMFLVTSNLGFFSETIRSGMAKLSLAFLIIWCYLEITQGSSRFRQIFGLAIASVIIYNFFA